MTMESMKQWWHDFDGANHKVLIQCDHKHLDHFQTSNVLSRRQAAWAEIHSSYDFVIGHLEGSKNPADGPSRTPDYELGYERPTVRPLATLTTNTVEPYNDLLPTIKAAQTTDSLGVDIHEKIVDIPILGTRDLSESGGQDGPPDPGDSQWSAI